MKTKSCYSTCIVAVLCISHVAFSTALDDYVALPDSNFSWSQYGPSEYTDHLYLVTPARGPMFLK